MKKPIDYSKDWKKWVKELKKYLTHETPCFVQNDKGDLISGTIQEINFKYWDVLVRFDSDKITKPGWKKVRNEMAGFGTYDMEDVDKYIDVWDENIPVKEMWLKYEYIKFSNIKK